MLTNALVNATDAELQVALEAVAVTDRERLAAVHLANHAEDGFPGYLRFSDILTVFLSALYSLGIAVCLQALDAPREIVSISESSLTVKPRYGLLIPQREERINKTPLFPYGMD